MFPPPPTKNGLAHCEICQVFYKSDYDYDFNANENKVF